jgi:hypothetical protein
MKLKRCSKRWKAEENEMVDEAERKILSMIEQGNLTAEEGLRLINVMQC